MPVKSKSAVDEARERPDRAPPLLGLVPGVGGDAMCLRAKRGHSLAARHDEVARAAGVARSTVYLVFGSRAGLFDALTTDLWERAGLHRLTEAVAAPDAREHLRGGLRAGVEIYAAIRDVAATLFSMSALDRDSVGGAIARLEQRRWGGMRYLAERLAEQDVLRPDVTVEQAADVLWLLAGFPSFDALHTGRGLSVDEIVDLHIAIAERSLCR